MSGMKKSDVLEQIMQMAGELAQPMGGKVTVDHLMAALLSCVTDAARRAALGDDEVTRQELFRTESIIKALPCKAAEAKEQLLSAVRENGNDSFMSNLLMQKLLCDAQNKATKGGLSVITADLLLRCLLDQPTRAVQQYVLLNAQSSRIAIPSSVLEGGAAPTPAPAPAAKPAAKPQKPAAAPKAPAEERPAAPAGKPAADKTEEAADGRSEMAQLIRRTKQTQSVLLDTVFGQENAIRTFINGYFQSELLAITDKTRVRPRATFLFAGPPGVGKTFLAEKAAECLGLPFLRLDMSEYSDNEANQVLTGFDQVYKRAKSGVLTDFVRQNPRCVLLFDEIEKAHLNVIHLFLQLLDAGRLQDAYHKQTVSFKDTIVLFTTNAGRQLYEETEAANLSGYSKKVVLKALEQDIDPRTHAPYFPAAICSRLASGHVVLFNRMEAHNLRKIARREVLRQAENLRREVGIESTFDESVFTAMLFAEGGSADARTVRARAETFFDTELFELLRLVENDAQNTSVTSVENIHFTVELPADPELAAFFRDEDKPQVLLFGSKELAARVPGESCAVLSADTVEEGCRLLEKEDIKLVLCDVRHGLKEVQGDLLHAEDAQSVGRDFLHRVLSGHNLPVYLLQTDEYVYSEDEKLSFQQEGVRDVFPLTASAEENDGALRDICAVLHQQQSMRRLSQANKLITFETAQSLSADGKQAKVKLFDLRAEMAVDAKDTKNVLGAMSKPKVRFADVIGCQDAKEELQYFIQYLKDPRKFRSTGVQAPKGVLLYGPPGTGKTLLAKAMAGESDVTFLTAEGNQFLKKYVGESPASVHELFSTARKYAPAILFIDEIDAIAKERTGDSYNTVREEVLTAFLTEMDGFNSDPTKPVFVLAATNFNVEPGTKKSLDPALMRRFDRRVFIDLPTQEERRQYLQMRVKGMPALRNISEEKLDNIVIRSTGMSLSDLASVVELALRSAIRSADGVVTDAIFDEAFETFNNGENKPWDADLLERVARHEAGHAFLYWYSGNTPAYLTIVARSDHGGYMQHDDRQGKVIHTRAELLDLIRTSLGGRAAEMMYYGPEEGLSSGACGDLEKATRRAVRLLCSYGMDERFGLATIDPEQVNMADAHSPVRQAVNEMLQAELERAISILSENRTKVDALVAALMEKNHMSGKEIDAVLRGAE